MNTHTELLNKLIQAIYDTPPCYETYRLAVLAAEIKGEMQAICEHCDTQSFTQSDCITISPDSDGWIENTGEVPKVDIESIRFRDRSFLEASSKMSYDWSITNSAYDITHYKPLNK